MWKFEFDSPVGLRILRYGWFGVCLGSSFK